MSKTMLVLGRLIQITNMLGVGFAIHRGEYTSAIVSALLVIIMQLVIMDRT